MSGPETVLEKETRKKDEKLQFSDLTDELTSHLMRKSDDQLLTELNQIFCIMNHRSCLKESYLLDLYFSGFLWMKEMNFCIKQTRFFMGLLHLMISNLQGKQMELVENLMEFIEAVSHQCFSSQKETRVKDIQEVCALISFLANSLFQRYKIYQLLFRAQRAELLIRAQGEVELFGCSVSPLEEGLPVQPDHLRLK